MSFEESEDYYEEEEEYPPPNPRLRRIIVAVTSIFLILVIFTSILPRPRDAGQRAVLVPRFTPDPGWSQYRGRTVEFWHPDYLGQEKLTVQELDFGNPFAPRTPFDEFWGSGNYAGADPVILILPRGAASNRSAEGYFSEISPELGGMEHLIDQAKINHPQYDAAGGIFEYSTSGESLTQLHFVIKSRGLFWQILVSAPSWVYQENERVIEEIIKSLFIIPYPIEEELVYVPAK